MSFSNAGGNCVPARAFSNVGVIVLFPKLGLICLISKCGRELCGFQNVEGNCIKAREFLNVGGIWLFTWDRFVSVPNVGAPSGGNMLIPKIYYMQWFLEVKISSNMLIFY